MKNDPEATTTNPRVGTKTGAWIRASLLVLLDAFFLGQGVISVLVGAWLLLVSLPLSFTRKNIPVRPERLRNIGIYATAVALVLVVTQANDYIARQRADRLVSAVNAYHEKYEKYPESLDALVPEFIEHVPLAMYTFVFNAFYYDKTQGGAALFYVDMPPFGRPSYSFDEQQWKYMD
jgi:hypothetical protein